MASATLPTLIMGIRHLAQVVVVVGRRARGQDIVWARRARARMIARIISSVAMGSVRTLS